MSRVLPADSVSTGGATTGAPRVDLSGANFKGARLTGACLVEADLDASGLWGTKFDGADQRGEMS